MPKFSEWLFGKPDPIQKVPNQTREQQALLNSILGQAMGMQGAAGGHNLAQQYFNNLLGPNQQQAYDQFSQPYLQQFEEQMLPQIAERFAGMGALSSSGFGQALGGAASNLQAQLAQLFSSLQGQAAQNQYSQFNQLSQTGLGHSPFQYVQREGNKGLLGSALDRFGSQMFSPITNSLGQGITGGISSLFKPRSAGGIT